MSWYRVWGIDEDDDRIEWLVEAKDLKDLSCIVGANEELSDLKIGGITEEKIYGVIPSGEFGWWWLCDIYHFEKNIDEDKEVRYLIEAQNVEGVIHQVKEQVKKQIGPCGIDRVERLMLGSVLRREEEKYGGGE